MDYITGRVLYDLDGTAERLGVGRATVKRHVRVLRQMGALVWLVHGSKRNLRLPGKKYTATATVYGAAVPPVYDEAMGHRIAGRGYGAWVCGVTEAGRVIAVEQARRACSDSQPDRPVDNRSSQGSEPPSLGSTCFVGKVKVSGGLNYTRKRARNRSHASTGPRKSSRESVERPSGPACGTTFRHRHDRSRGRTPAQARRDIELARQLHFSVPWLRPEQDLRHLAFVLRPLIDTEPDAAALAATLTAWSWTWSPGWAPQRPAAYIAARLADSGLHQALTTVELARKQQLDAERAAQQRQTEQQEAARRAAHAARPCADCGKPACSGLCAVCDYTRQIQPVLEEAVLTGIMPNTDPRDPAAVQQAVGDCLRDTRTILDQHTPLTEGSGLEAVLARLSLTETLRNRRQEAVLQHFATDSEAEAAATRAHHRALASNGRLYPTPDQLDQARQAGHTARQRAARTLWNEALAALAPAARPHLHEAPTSTPDPSPHPCSAQDPTGTPCTRPALPHRTVCLRHHAADLAVITAS